MAKRHGKRKRTKKRDCPERCGRTFHAGHTCAQAKAADWPLAKSVLAHHEYLEHLAEQAEPDDG